MVRVLGFALFGAWPFLRAFRVRGLEINYKSIKSNQIDPRCKGHSPSQQNGTGCSETPNSGIVAEHGIPLELRTRQTATLARHPPIICKPFLASRTDSGKRFRRVACASGILPVALASWQNGTIFFGQTRPHGVGRPLRQQWRTSRLEP